MVSKKFRRKPIILEAVQWFKNGDHPLDYVEDTHGYENGELRVFTGADRKAKGWEGALVRYFRHPKIEDESTCKDCGQIMLNHGFIDTHPISHKVCPGDWIITQLFEYIPCKPDIFAATYEEVQGE